MDAVLTWVLQATHFLRDHLWWVLGAIVLHFVIFTAVLMFCAALITNNQRKYPIPDQRRWDELQLTYIRWCTLMALIPGVQTVLVLFAVLGMLSGIATGLCRDMPGIYRLAWRRVFGIHHRGK
jgi:hypothetical protein